MHKFVEGIKAIYDLEKSFQKLCEITNNSSKRCDQLIYKKLGENKEVK